MSHNSSNNETSMNTTFLESGQILAKIKNLLESPNITEIDFAIAYLSSGGYSEVEKSLVEFLKRKGKLKFLVGLSDVYATESCAVRDLLKLSFNHRNNLLEVKYHKMKGKEFHPKLVIAKSNDAIESVIVGSSNLTSGGQRNNVEANVFVDCRSSDSENQLFVTNVNNFFEYIWAAGKPLGAEIIKKYSLGEKERKKPKAATQNKVPETKLYPFIYLDGKRHEVRKVFEVLCSDCRENYVAIPLDSIFCDDCGSYISVYSPQPEEKDFAGKSKFAKTSIRIDGRKATSKIVDLACPDCPAPLNMSSDLKLWVICDECAKERKHKREYVCKPFANWDDITTKNLNYSIDKNRLKVFRK